MRVDLAAHLVSELHYGTLTHLEVPMTTALEVLQQQVLSLTPADRSRLLDRLVESLDDERSLHEEWDAEAARRDAEIEDGTSVPVDGKAVVARLRAMIR